MPGDRGTGMNLEMIGEGFEWPGTPRIKAALEVLGFGPKNHIRGLFEHPEGIGPQCEGSRSAGSLPGAPGGPPGPVRKPARTRFSVGREAGGEVLPTNREVPSVACLLFSFSPKRRMIGVHAGAPAEKFAGSDDPASHRRRSSLFFRVAETFGRPSRFFLGV